MKFCEAVDLLKSGSRISRQIWKDEIYFMKIGNEVESFQPRITPYQFNEDIMISEGWIVSGNMNEFTFCEIIPFLQHGAQAKLKDWREMFIYLEPMSNMLVLHSMEIHPFVPDFESFIANDWIEV